MRSVSLLPLILAAAIGAALLNGCSRQADREPAAPANAAGDNALSLAQPALDQYRAYVVEQCDALVKATEEFASAVAAGDLDKARALYAPARMHYERIEPIAESLGDLDPDIDARENDVASDDWSGFHRIEKALWADGTTEGQRIYADKLVQDVQLLRAKVESVSIDAGTLIVGSVELLNEVSSSKITGEEERYSHTDLYDVAANVEGARKIFELLKPALQGSGNADLADTVEQRFAALQDVLAAYKDGAGYLPYTELNQEQTKKLSQAVDALAEPLSRLGAIAGT